MEETKQTKGNGVPRRLSPGNWVAIVAIAAGILGWVLDGALGEHNRRIGGIEQRVAGLETGQQALARSVAEVSGNLKALGERFAAMDDGLDERFAAMDRRFDERFAAMDRRFDERFAAMDQRLARIETSIDRLAGAETGTADVEPEDGRTAEAASTRQRQADAVD